MRKYLIGISVFVLAFGVLSISVLKSASVFYVLATSQPTPTSSSSDKKINVDYNLPFPGKIKPDSPLWSFKAGRDIIWYQVTMSTSKRAELALLFSDKRLSLAKSLFENGKPDVALTTLTKGEKYLEIAQNQERSAREKGEDTSTFLIKLATSALKHRETIEGMLDLGPEDARPEMIRIEDYSKNAYKAARDALNSKGISAPKDPFDGH